MTRHGFSVRIFIPSGEPATGVLLGRSANGRIEWKDAKGRTLKDLQEAATATP